MPRNSREQLIRYHDQAQNDLDRVLSRLQLMGEMYGEIKPEHTAYIENVAVMTIQVKDFLQDFRHRFM